MSTTVGPFLHGLSHAPEVISILMLKAAANARMLFLSIVVVNLSRVNKDLTKICA